MSAGLRLPDVAMLWCGRPVAREAIVKSPTKARRHWRQFLVALGLGGIIALLAIAYTEENAGLAILGAYCIPTNSILPLPHEPGLLFFANYYDPLWIAIVGTIASGIAAFVDYATVEGAMRFASVRRAKNGKWFRWATKSFMKQPFATVWLFAISPLPVSVVRILSPAAGYNVWKYVAAMMLGRLPRFYLFAWIGRVFPIPGWVLLVAVAAPILMLIFASTSSEPVSEALEDDAEA